MKLTAVILNRRLSQTNRQAISHLQLLFTEKRQSSNASLTRLGLLLVIVESLKS